MVHPIFFLHLILLKNLGENKSKHIFEPQEFFYKITSRGVYSSSTAHVFSPIPLASKTKLIVVKMTTKAAKIIKLKSTLTSEKP